MCVWVWVRALLSDERWCGAVCARALWVWCGLGVVVCVWMGAKGGRACAPVCAVLLRCEGGVARRAAACVCAPPSHSTRGASPLCHMRAHTHKHTGSFKRFQHTHTHTHTVTHSPLRRPACAPMPMHEHECMSTYAHPRRRTRRQARGEEGRAAHLSEDALIAMTSHRSRWQNM